MAFNRFSMLLTGRLIFILGLFIIIAALVNTPGYHATTVFVGLIAAVCIVETWYFSHFINRELTRFLDAVRYMDVGQRFEFSHLGKDFSEIGSSFHVILNKINRLRVKQEEKLKHIKALIEQVPFPLFSLYENGNITFWNQAARKLFSNFSVTRKEDLKQFGANFFEGLLSLQNAGERKLVRFNIGGLEQLYMVTSSHIITAGGKEQLISLQDIQNELEATQLEAWQDLVSVLTHEIMNSVTPISSLAKTASDLITEIREDKAVHETLDGDLKDIEEAVKTVARRSEGLTDFVGSYRQLTRLPAPNKTRFKADKLFETVERLLAPTWETKGITFTSEVKPDHLELYADTKMIEQLLINLLQNAEHAVGECKAPSIELRAYINNRSRVVIEVADNGTGISREVASKIFVPFYTTKRSGSGVGLALVRQIMMTHKGSVSHSDNDRGGSIFTLTF